MKKVFFILFLIFTITSSSYAASSSSGTNTKSNYDKAVKLIKFAKKYEQKGKIDKANKSIAYEKKYPLEKCLKETFAWYNQNVFSGKGISVRHKLPSYIIKGRESINIYLTMINDRVANLFNLIV